MAADIRTAIIHSTSCSFTSVQGAVVKHCSLNALRSLVDIIWTQATCCWCLSNHNISEWHAWYIAQQVVARTVLAERASFLIAVIVGLVCVPAKMAAEM